MTRESRRTRGRYTWLRDHLPSPAWGPAAEVPDAAWHTGRAFEPAVEATRACLACFGALGLRPLEPDRDVERWHRMVVMGWAGDRIAVLVGVRSDRRLSVLVMAVQPGLVSVAQLIRRSQRMPPTMIRGGAFWLTGGDRPALDAEIGAHLAPLLAGLGDDPDAVDLLALGSALREEERRVALERHVPLLEREAAGAWQARDWSRYVMLAGQMAAFGIIGDPDRRHEAEAELAGMLAEPAWPATVDDIGGASKQVDRVFRGDDETLGTAALDVAYDRMVPDELWDAIERLKQGDPTAVEPALVFLEADPWAFRTGYIKQKIMRRLRRCPLEPDQQARLRATLLFLVEVGGRWEYREACRLAWRVADPPFMDALRALSRRSDWPVSERAQWMLDAIRPPAGT